MKTILRNHRLFPRLTQLMRGAFDQIVEILKTNSNPVLHKQLPYCASIMILQSRMMAVHDAVEAGQLIVPEDPKHSTVAMWMVVH